MYNWITARGMLYYSHVLIEKYELKANQQVDLQLAEHFTLVTKLIPQFLFSVFTPSNSYIMDQVSLLKIEIQE